MPTFSRHKIHSACAKYKERNGVLSIQYSGLITTSVFNRLDVAMAPIRVRNRIALENISDALTVHEGFDVLPEGWPADTPISVVIVRDDQYAICSEFSRILATMGVVRVVFLQRQFDEALSFAERISGDRLYLLRP
jgi:hypothetical protein